MEALHLGQTAFFGKLVVGIVAALRTVENR